MKAYLETIPQVPDQSISMLDRKLDEGIPFEWHQHPEFELTLTLNSQGHRYIGDSIVPYTEDDLVLVGPNTPHTWHSEKAIRASEPHHAIVLWFASQWIDQLVSVCPEWQSLQRLTEHALGALTFSDTVRNAVIPAIRNIVTASPADRVSMLLSVLLMLSRDEQAVPLCRQFLKPSGDDRLRPVIDCLNQRFAQPPDTDSLASMVHLSPSSFQRLFKRQTHRTPSQYIAQLRIGHACAQLISSDRQIAAIAHQVGYHSLAQFNKTFRTLKGCSPREFRTKFRRF